MPKTTVPQVSIIVPVYNVEDYLPRSLASIQAQTLADWECVCVDDGSTDGGGAILDEWAAKDSRFVAIHQENCGGAAARNAGLEVARGEYIGFVDPDDWIEAETYELALDTARRSNADIVQWRYIMEKDGEFIPSKEGAEGLFDVRQAYKEYFAFNVWSKLFRRAFLVENDIRFLQGVRWENDVYFSIVAYALAKRRVFINRTLHHYTVRQTSLTFDGALPAKMREGVDTLKRQCEGMRRIEYLLKKEDISEIAGRKLGSFLFVYKLRIKDKAIFAFPRPDYSLFRSTFPELNWQMLPHFLKKRTGRSLKMLLAVWHLGALAEALTRLKRKVKGEP